jgi:Pyridoxamine 5'-phosphate oxidase
VGRAAEVLRTICYATVATADSQARPWNSPVYSVRDNDLNIYWVSDRQNQHSQNIRQNPQVFIVYYDSTALPGQGEGVYFSATAVELRDPEDIRAARQVIDGCDSCSANEYSGNSVCRIYRATPTHAWMNTFEERDGVFIRDFRIEIPLSDLRLAVGLAFYRHVGPVLVAVESVAPSPWWPSSGSCRGERWRQVPSRNPAVRRTLAPPAKRTRADLRNGSH